MRTFDDEKSAQQIHVCTYVVQTEKSMDMPDKPSCRSIYSQEITKDIPQLHFHHTHVHQG